MPTSWWQYLINGKTYGCCYFFFFLIQRFLGGYMLCSVILLQLQLCKPFCCIGMAHLVRFQELLSFLMNCCLYKPKERDSVKKHHFNKANMPMNTVHIHVRQDTGMQCGGFIAKSSFTENLLLLSSNIYAFFVYPLYDPY